MIKLKSVAQAARELPPDVPIEYHKRILKLASSSKIKPLPLERASYGEFLYMLGQDYGSISAKMGTDPYVIYLTSSFYDWHQKKENANVSSERAGVTRVMKNILSTLLAGTASAVETELLLVSTGQLDPREAAFMPKNLREMGTLINMLKEAYRLTGKHSSSDNKNPVNVMINNNAHAIEETMKKIDGEGANSMSKSFGNLSREEKLKAMLSVKKDG